MKAENILKSDVLDILFQNKNKDYGAYELRKFYPNRLKKSIGLMILLVLIFAGMQSWKPIRKAGDYIGALSDTMKLTTFIIPKDNPIEIEKTKAVKTPLKAQVPDFVPVIVPNDLAKNNMPTNEQKDTTQLGTKFIDGTASKGNIDDGLGNLKGKQGGGKTGDNDKEKNNDDDDMPITNPSEYPVFPGGSEALKNFMIRNLSQPDNIEEGEKFIVIAKFIVDKQGNISNIEVVKNGREDLDDEVKRVIAKMPQWKPGSQNGNPVAVYFKMPVTFVNNN